MAGSMVKKQYVSDDGNTYVIRVDATNAAALASPPTGSLARVNLPRGYVPRHVWAVDDSDTTGGRTPTMARRKIVVFSVSDAEWTGSDTTIQLPDFSVTPSVAVDFKILSYVGEVRYNR